MRALRLAGYAIAAAVILVLALGGSVYCCAGYLLAWVEPGDVFGPEWRLAQARSSLLKPDDEYQRWVHLGPIAVWTVDSGDLLAANAMANELLELAPRYRKDWNYGNAIQDVNIVRGRIALRLGNKEAAKGFLREAGRTPGSPQLNTFGPNLILARELLEAGEREAVLEYFDLIDRFWKGSAGAPTAWRHQIAMGRVPAFAMNIH